MVSTTRKQGSSLTHLTLASTWRAVVWHTSVRWPVSSTRDQATSGRSSKGSRGRGAKCYRKTALLMTSFTAKYGKQLPEEKLLSLSYYESFAEKLAVGALKAEPLSMVVSMFVEALSKQYNVPLDSKLTIATKKSWSPLSLLTRRRYVKSTTS